MNRIEQLKQFLKESPKEPFLLFALALEYQKIDDSAQSLKYFRQLSNEHPEYVGTYYHLGKLLETKEKFEEALVTYQTGMKIAMAQKDYHSHNELQSAYNQLSDELLM